LGFSPGTALEGRGFKPRRAGQHYRAALAAEVPLTTAIENATPQATAKGVTVTEKAIAKIRSAMAKEGISPEQGGLRLGVQGGGCSGLSYNIRFDTQPRERDRIFQFDDVRVFVDPKSFIYLHGMILDYQETLMQQGFVFVNPQATKSCGCGTSFSA
jgi:iron-sulfur cluster assembly protein